MALSCGSGGSTGAEIVDRINLNTDAVEDHDTRVNDLETTVVDHETRIAANETAITALQQRAPRASMAVTTSQTLSLSDDATPTIIAIFDTVVTERGGLEADTTLGRLTNTSGGTFEDCVVSIGFDVEFPGTEEMELSVYHNGTPIAASPAFYLRGIGSNKPVVIFWQGEITLNDGDYIDIRARNAASGNVDVNVLRATYRIDYV